MFNWIQFLTYAVVTMFTPGPNTILSMSNAGRVGLRKGVFLNFGMLCGFSIVSLTCTLFCTLLLEALPMIHTPMLVLGAVYMLFLAWKLWTKGAVIQGDDQQNGFRTGVVLQFVNLKIYIYIIVSMQVYILPYYGDQPLALVGFALLLAFVGFVGGLAWAVGGSVLKVLFSQYATLTNRILALTLVYCAVALFI